MLDLIIIFHLQALVCANTKAPTESFIFDLEEIKNLEAAYDIY